MFKEPKMSDLDLQSNSLEIKDVPEPQPSPPINPPNPCLKCAPIKVTIHVPICDRPTLSINGGEFLILPVGCREFKITFETLENLVIIIRARTQTFKRTFNGVCGTFLADNVSLRLRP